MGGLADDTVVTLDGMSLGKVTYIGKASDPVVTFGSLGEAEIMEFNALFAAIMARRAATKQKTFPARALRHGTQLIGLRFPGDNHG